MLLPPILLAVTALGSPVDHPSSTATCRPAIEAGAYLPFEVGTGVVIGSGSTTVPWSASLRASPTIGLRTRGSMRSVRLGLVAGRGYGAHGWEWLYGARAGYRFWEAPIGLAALEAGAEAVWGDEGRNPFSVYATGEALSRFMLTVRGGPDLGNSAWFLEVAFGYQSVFSSAAPVEIPPPLENPTFVDLIRLETRSRLDAVAVVQDSADDAFYDCEFVARMEDALAAEQSSPSVSLDAFRQQMREHGLAVLADEIDGIVAFAKASYQSHYVRPAEPTLPTPEMILEGLTRGIRESIAIAHKSEMPELVGEVAP